MNIYNFFFCCTDQARDQTEKGRPWIHLKRITNSHALFEATNYQEGKEEAIVGSQTPLSEANSPQNTVFLASFVRLYYIQNLSAVSLL